MAQLHLVRSCEVLVLVPLGYRCCYCGGALYFFFLAAGVGWDHQHFTLAGDPGRAAVVGGSVWLRSIGQQVVAIVLLLGVAIPVALLGLFFLLLLILHPNFH